MLTLTEIFLKSRVGVYKDTPENRRLHRVGQKYGFTKEEQKQKEQDDSIARIKAQQKESDKQYSKAEELLQALKSRGLDEFTISRSITSFGVSTYVQGYGLKFRISDHSVTSHYRMMNENFFNYDSDVEMLADYAKEHYDAIQERARKWQEESDRRKAEEKELDDYWESIRNEFDGRVFGENNRTYADPKTFAEKHPEWTDIHATPLGGGAYSYEWAQRSAYGRRKPSYAWLRWHRETHGEVRKSMPRSLTDLCLMKSYKKLVIEKPHKYIRKWLENGVWHYEYPKDSNDEVRVYYREPDKGKNKQGGYGTIWGDYSGKPKEAFEKLFQERTGQCVNVFSVKLPVLIKKGGKFEVLKSAKTRKPILADTSIDLVWGDKTKNRGLEHIIDDHYVCHDDFSSIEELQSKIIEELSRLNYLDSSNRESQFFNQSAKMQFRIAGASGQKFVFVIQWGGMDKDGRCLFRHFILTSYDLSKGEVENSEEEREKRQKIFDEYGK